MEFERTFRAEVCAYAMGLLKTGLDSDESMQEKLWEHASESLESVGIALDEDAVEQIVREELASARRAFLAEMATWPKVTDCDRLDAAFTELNTMGIMARHNWTCCGSCGPAAMPDEFHRLGGMIQGKPIIGYVFYHQQCTESAVRGSSIYISYGTTLGGDTDEEYERRSVEIARTACDVLAKHGLRTVWNGMFSKRPEILLDWKRRSAPKDYVDLDALHMADAGTPAEGSTQGPISQSDGGVAMLGAQPPTLIARIISIFTGRK